MEYDINGRAIWPFPSINGIRTQESENLIALPPEPKKSLYDKVMTDPETQEALI